jgi:hypothetical protein
MKPVYDLPRLTCLAAQQFITVLSKQATADVLVAGCEEAGLSRAAIWCCLQNYGSYSLPSAVWHCLQSGSIADALQSNTGTLRQTMHDTVVRVNLEVQRPDHDTAALNTALAGIVDQAGLLRAVGGVSGLLTAMGGVSTQLSAWEVKLRLTGPSRGDHPRFGIDAAGAMVKLAMGPESKKTERLVLALGHARVSLTAAAMEHLLTSRPASALLLFGAAAHVDTRPHDGARDPYRLMFGSCSTAEGWFAAAAVFAAEGRGDVSSECISRGVGLLEAAANAAGQVTFDCQAAFNLQLGPCFELLQAKHQAMPEEQQQIDVHRARMQALYGAVGCHDGQVYYQQPL